jgi:multiple sugar transport system ATP-binding protein
MEIYSKPINRFVAGFFGLPPMNFLTGGIDFENDKPGFSLGQVKINLPAKLSNRLLPYKGKEIVLGIRPEHLSLSPIQRQGENTVLVTVDLVEPLGARTYVYFTSVAGARLVADVSRYFDLHHGDAARVHLDVEQLHVFELGGMGKNISI